jgi:hypothetical protein
MKSLEEISKRTKRLTINTHLPSLRAKRQRLKKLKGPMISSHERVVIYRQTAKFDA